MSQMRRMVIGRLAVPRRAVLAAGGVLLMGMGLMTAACNTQGGGQTSSNQVTTSKVPWCDQPQISFQDDGKVSHPQLTDWNAVKGQLGFSPYLPASFPKGTCLALAGGSIHDPIFGGRFLITYYIPGTGALSFSEAPKSTGGASHIPDKVQCSQAAPTPTPTAAATSATPSPGATPTPALTVCMGTISATTVSLASAIAPADLEKTFNSLQPNVDWLPPQKATPAPTGSATP